MAMDWLMDKFAIKYRILVIASLASLLFLGVGCGGGSTTTSPPPPPPPPHSVGANVAENTETAIIYVDGTAGNDNNNGSQNSPLQTINKALAVANANNQNNVGTQVNVNPGIYREQLNFQPSNTTSPFTLQATKAGTVFVSGADSLPGNTWAVSSFGANIFTNSSTSSYIFA